MMDLGLENETVMTMDGEICTACWRSVLFRVIRSRVIRELFVYYMRFCSFFFVVGGW